MSNTSHLPTELFLDAQPGSAREIEHICDLATARPEGDVIAIAVAPMHVSRSSRLLFGTGVGIVSTLPGNDRAGFVPTARLSVATGATEIALPQVALDHPEVIDDLKSFLGSSIPLTVDITSVHGDADLASAERALILGADFVSFTPRAHTNNWTRQMANLVATAGRLQLGGVKVATDQHLPMLGDRGATERGNTRRCLPIAASVSGVRS